MSFSISINNDDKTSKPSYNKNIVSAKNNQIMGILPRRTCVWIDDESVDECYLCHTKFGWYYTRRHHCRGCGRIFCANCSKYVIEALDVNKSGLINPEKYLTDCLSNPRVLQSHRSCKECMLIFDKIRQLSTLIAVFEILPFELTEYYNLRGVNRMWNEACNIFLSRFREIQYNLPNHYFSQFETKMLKSNLHLILGHNKLICQFIKSFDWDHASNDDFEFYLKLIQSHEQTCSCCHLMCSRECQKKLGDSEVIDILLHVNSPRVREIAIDYLSTDNGIIESYVPILTYAIRLDEVTYKNNSQLYTIRDHLIGLSLQSDQIRYKFFWELLVQLEEPQYNSTYRETLDLFFNEIEENLGSNCLYDLKNGMKLVNIFSQLSLNSKEFDKTKEWDKKLIDHLIDNNIYKKEIPLPIHPSFIIDTINYKNVKVMNSATKPIYIPCQVKNMEEPYAFIYKSEDIRKDNIISSIIKIMDRILKNNGLDMHIVTYNVLPTAMSSGLIEIVPNSETLYNIKELNKCSVQNYILENNSKLPIDEVRNRFIKSTAVYCVITYLLGIGDRHMDNIMVTQDGRLFHIDYSFVLGLDPKPLAPKMRITDEMIDALGGVNSASYKQFEEYCSQCYNILRKHANLFTNMLFLLTKVGNIKFTLDQLEIEISKRFLPGEYQSQAKIHLIKTINNSKSASTFIDFIHYHYKESLSIDRWGSFDIYEKANNLISNIAYYNPFSRGDHHHQIARNIRLLPEPPILSHAPQLNISNITSSITSNISNITASIVAMPVNTSKTQT